MMDEEQLKCYRINYNSEYWVGVAEKVGNQCSSPVGAVLAVNALCDEVERLRKCLKWQQDRADTIGTHGDNCYLWGTRHYECALREIDRLHEQLAACQQDAARYRWLRNRIGAEAYDLVICKPRPSNVGAYELDAAIDAATKGS